MMKFTLVYLTKIVGGNGGGYGCRHGGFGGGYGEFGGIRGGSGGFGSWNGVSLRIWML